jgi:hypothetical protein
MKFPIVQFFNVATTSDTGTGYEHSYGVGCGFHDLQGLSSTGAYGNHNGNHSSSTNSTQSQSSLSAGSNHNLIDNAESSHPCFNWRNDPTKLWCGSAWCYTKKMPGFNDYAALAGTVTHTKSSDPFCALTARPSALGGGVHYSYATCGYIDRWYVWLRSGLLRGISEELCSGISLGI